MKKAAIITIVDFTNIGNRLQNYAVQEILKKLDVQPETLRKTNSIKAFIKYFLRKYVLCGISSANRTFSDRYIRWSRYAQYGSNYRGGGYDYYIVGSDQVWNPYFCDETRKRLFFLDEFPPEKGIALSASTGVDTIPEEWIPWFRTHLCNFKDISVREFSGAEIVSELTDGKKCAEVLIDPTLFFDGEEWDGIAVAPKHVPVRDKYILTYFLGELPEQAEQTIHDQIEKNRYNVIHIADLIKAKSFIGPSEFVYLFSNASLILTDSFHGSVFSFLYQKPFLVYSRSGFSGKTSMMSRMDTFLSNFDLQRKYAESGLENDLFECDYHVGRERLKREREKMINFLHNALEL